MDCEGFGVIAEKPAPRPNGNYDGAVMLKTERLDSSIRRESDPCDA